ncbi:uncharacterized protein LOC115668163 [Syzygium oleosum]|uniref:uncharacterized protein LOC115668163 n=1 Tax=Syzygium oleosum TaxID=219896 RepID=UPI0024BB7163|nr:uncharacterized protein LOC115668163 [Syzygium oleosum]
MATSSPYKYFILCSDSSTRDIYNFAMEQVQPLSKEKSPVTLLLPGDAEEKAPQISGPLVLEAKQSNDDHRGSAPVIDPLKSLEIAPREKPETPKRDSNNTLATRAYSCKYCTAKFGTFQSLGGHQKAHKREHAARKRAAEKERMANDLSQVNPNFSPCYFGMQAIPIPRHPGAFRPRTWPAPTDVYGPIYGGPQRPTTLTSPQASAWHRPAVANRLNGMVYQLTNCNGGPNFHTTVSPRSTGPKPPPANVLANGDSLSTQGLENEGLDLSLRL